MVEPTAIPPVVDTTGEATDEKPNEDVAALKESLVERDRQVQELMARTQTLTTTTSQITKIGSSIPTHATLIATTTLYLTGMSTISMVLTL